ncbi:MAG: 2-oxo acid dehydrogenase subunit E2 [Phycisphaerae bacterium]|nr:2-oxo acid dehydrogenase subunit E2 [Phycisphaerae bacterium]
MAHASTDPNVFILPDLGEGVHEAELLKWRVSVGQTVNELDVLADMETDKAVVEVPSPRAGKIKTLHGNEGDILNTGNPFVTFEGESAAPSKPASPPPRAVAAEEIPEPSAEREDQGSVVGMPGANPIGDSDGKALATPAVRRLARDLGIDIDSVKGTGIGGRVTEKDVRAAQGGAQSATAVPAGPRSRPAAPAPAPSPRVHPPSPPRAAPPVSAPPPMTPASLPVARPAAPAQTDGETLRIPFRGVRRTIANRLRESVNQAVHFTVMDEADVSALDSLRRKLAAASGEKVSFLPFVASAVCRVLGDARFRALNATVDEKPGDANYEPSIVQHRSVHLGIATDTDNGLMVPVVRDADRLGVLEISRSIGAIAEAARNRSAGREQLTGSTFTISNVGSHAGRFATPIINYPEVGILAVGRGREGVVAHKGAFRVGFLLPLSLACDHRVVDGATAALALAEVVRLLQEQPDSLFAPAKG